MSLTVELIYRESWRLDIWDDDVPSRPGWQVRCSVHGLLGNPPGWAYAERGRAHGVVTRHRQKHDRVERQDLTRKADGE